MTSAGLQRIWALAGRFGAASALGLAQLYTAELLSSDVQQAALTASAQVCLHLAMDAGLPPTHPSDAAAPPSLAPEAVDAVRAVLLLVLYDPLHVLVM